MIQPGNELKATACFYVEMYDSFGDGWNGATYSIYNSNDSLVITGTLSTGTYGYNYHCLPDGCYTISVSAGGFPAEISWDVLASNFSVIAAGGAPSNDNSFTIGFPVYGCTSNFACNYSSVATCDDGSCCYSNCVSISLYDSFGDGWNGGGLTIRDNSGVLVYSGAVPSGADSTYSTLCLPTGCYLIEVTGGSFPSEIYWSMTAYHNYFGGNTIIASGGAPDGQYVGVGADCENVGCINPQSCNYNSLAIYSGGICCLDHCVSMYMYDSFGDGWNGAHYYIRDWNGEIRVEGTLYYGDFSVEDCCLQDGCYTLEVSGGGFASEISWILYEYTSLYLAGAGSGVFPFAIGTSLPGCTNPSASNYQANATCDDGTCAVTCQADLNGDGVVNVTDLLLFMSEFGTNC